MQEDLDLPISRPERDARGGSSNQRAPERGDALLQLLRSRIGAPPEAKAVLDSLGLRRVGHSRVISAAAIGSGGLRTLQPWMAAYPLTLNAAETLGGMGVRGIDRWGHAGSPDRTRPDEYEREAARGWYFDWSARASRDYLSFQSLEDGLALGWSTALPLTTLLEVLAADVGDSDVLKNSRASVSDWSAGRWRSGNAATLLAEMRRGWRPYQVATLTLPHRVLQWRMPAFPRHVDERVRSGDIRVRIEDGGALPAAVVRSFIIATATPRVGCQLNDDDVFDLLASEFSFPRKSTDRRTAEK